MKFFDDMSSEQRVFSFAAFLIIVFFAICIISATKKGSLRITECSKVLTACYQSDNQDCECKL